MLNSQVATAWVFFICWTLLSQLGCLKLTSTQKFSRRYTTPSLPSSKLRQMKPSDKLQQIAKRITLVDPLTHFQMAWEHEARTAQVDARKLHETSERLLRGIN